MKNDLGFIFLELHQTQQHNILIDIISETIRGNPFNQICIFNHYSSRIGYNNVPVFPISHAKFFDGNIFIFDPLSLNIARNFPNIKNKYFYCTDILWSNTDSEYEVYKDILLDSTLKIITSNEKVKDLYKICWNINTIDIKYFCYEEIVNAIRQTE